MSAPVSPWRLLIVDDDEAIVELLTLRLKKQGYDIRTARDGEEGYQVADEFRPHIILCDVVMPRMDGLTFCRRMRDEKKEIPFLFLTAKGQPREKVEVLSAGGDDCIVKPFDPQELNARLQTILRRHYPEDKNLAK